MPLRSNEKNCGVFASCVTVWSACHWAGQEHAQQPHHVGHGGGLRVQQRHPWFKNMDKMIHYANLVCCSASLTQTPYLTSLFLTKADPPHVQTTSADPKCQFTRADSPHVSVASVDPPPPYLTSADPPNLY